MILQINLDDILDVDTSAIPTPFPPSMEFAKDQRFTLVYNQELQKWVADPEPVITAIDGGTY
jgi:hypothetical protein